MLAFAIGLVIVADLSTPRATVLTFGEALAKGDTATLAKCVQLKSETPPDITRLAPMFKSISEMGIKVSVTNEVITGDKATVTAETSFTRESNLEKLSETLDLARTGQEWRIVPGPASGQLNSDRRPLYVIACFVADPAELERVFASARTAALGTQALSKIKQIALACQIFLTDNNEKFLIADRVLEARLMPYLRNASLFEFPGQTGRAFSFNDALTGVPLAKVTQPANTVMVYYGSGGKLKYTPEGQTYVGMVDGSARKITRAEAPSLRWRP